MRVLAFPRTMLLRSYDARLSEEQEPPYEAKETLSYAWYEHEELENRDDLIQVVVFLVLRTEYRKLGLITLPTGEKSCGIPYHLAEEAGIELPDLYTARAFFHGPFPTIHFSNQKLDVSFLRTEDKRNEPLFIEKLHVDSYSKFYEASFLWGTRYLNHLVYAAIFSVENRYVSFLASIPTFYALDLLDIPDLHPISRMFVSSRLMASGTDFIFIDI